MHPEISNEDIVYAERILFGERGKFDQERKDFIKNLDSIDLQAVPGSGKTTALLAKLLILQKHQPFSDEAGILVISHTNKAVDIIRKRIGLQAPNLFKYPNYIGTIQSFVDQYLAIPFFISEFGFKPQRIDADNYYERMELGLSRFLQGFSRQEQNNAKYYLRYFRLINSYRFDFDESGRFILVDKINGQELTYIKPRRGKNYTDFTVQEKNRIKEWLVDLKLSVWKKNGCLHYDDAYFLAKYYLNKYARIKKIMQNRFRYVFVDEMQDMELHQINILEKLFRVKKTKNHIYQRIGDNNQSIFSGFVHEDAIWQSSEIQKSLKKSIRLSSVNAQKVEPFGIKTAEIIGSNEQVNKNPLHPHLIIFDDNTISEVIPHFSKLIRNYQNEGKIPRTPKNGFNAIGWVKENEEDGRLSVKDYFPSYNIEIAKGSYSDLNSLEDYVFRAEKKNTSKAFHKALIDSILLILKLEEVKNADGRNFTKRTLIKYLIENEDLKKQNYYDELLLGLYKMCSICIKSGINELRPVFSSFISTFLREIFGKNKLSDKSVSFIEETRIPDQEDNEEFFDDNFYRDEDISIEVGTVHSVKGETHCATLYMETFYHKKYESERLLNQLKGNPFNDGKKFHKQSTKVAYVGLSRPTHFVCFAAHIKRIKENLVDIEGNGWVIDKDLIND